MRDSLIFTIALQRLVVLDEVPDAYILGSIAVVIKPDCGRVKTWRIQARLAGDGNFPGILRESRPCRLPVLRILGIADCGRVYQTEQETRVGEADAASLQVLSLRRRQAGWNSTERMRWKWK
jgi:hypothetical protein